MKRSPAQKSPVKTRRYLDVDSTFIERYGRQMDVKPTLFGTGIMIRKKELRIGLSICRANQTGHEYFVYVATIHSCLLYKVVKIKLEISSILYISALQYRF